MSQTPRIAEHKIADIFTARWSPRAFEAKPIAESELMRLFEAARWAPSASNLQPWRYVYALRETPAFDALVATLVPFNQDWAKHASALVFLASVTTLDGVQPVAYHSFDAGASWMALALQAHDQGLITHGMAGVDFAKAAEVLNLPETFKLEAAIAVGYHGDPETLPAHLKEREAPSDRQALSTMVFKDRF
jgi:nitroreductase